MLSRLLMGPVFLLLVLTPSFLFGGPPDVDRTHRLRFERDVLPILARHCHECHGAKAPKRGLDLRGIRSLVDGGQSGVIAVPGKPGQSYLFQMVRRQTMPPRGKAKLSKAEVETIRSWIAGGMLADTPYTIPQPRDLVGPGDRQHWSFQRLSRPTVPVVNSSSDVVTAVDAFVQARLEMAGLGMAEPADRATLLRRVVLDLLGRPPFPAEQDRFLSDSMPGAWQRQVDRLLASPEFGQRFGRHWLDVAGYADTVGFDHVPTQVIMTEGKWRYRDYVIDAINADHRFDHFLHEQLAGDELVDWKRADHYTPEIVRNLVATGFMRTARDQTHESVGVITPNYYEVLFETMDVVTGGLLGLSIKCARCHDHKFDAVPQQDYYRLMATLMTSYNPADWRPVYRFDAKVNERSIFDVSKTTRREIDDENVRRDRAIDSQQKRIKAVRGTAGSRILAVKRAAVPEPIRADVVAAIAADPKNRSPVEKYLAGRFEKLLKVVDAEIDGELVAKEKATIALAEETIGDLQQQRRGYGRIQALFDVGKVSTTFVLRRGDFRYPGIPVAPGYPSVLCDTPGQSVMTPAKVPAGTSGRRLALARWLTRPQTRASALVTRVLVNRFWQALFGKGLVRTSGEFGVQGTPPTHPLLLDWLAGEFQRHDWQVKPLLRLLLVSRVYRQSSRPVDSNRARQVDPGNRLLWKMPLRRLESEAVRDSLLAVSSRLDRSLGGPPVPQSAHSDGRITINAEALKRPFDRWRRSVYLVTRRGYAVTVLDVFDQPSILTTCSRREASAVPLQSLTMINGPFADERARGLAEAVLSGARAGADDRFQSDRVIQAVYRRALCRRADIEELRLCRAALQAQRKSFLAAGRDEMQSMRQAVVELCHTILNTSEFLYRE